MGDDRPLRYTETQEDGTIKVVYRASGLGACDGVVLGLARGRKPAATPEWLQEVFDEGTRMESVIIEQLLERSSTLNLNTQDEWELEVGEVNDKLVVVRGHSDGWDEHLQMFVEAKKFRDSTWPKFLTGKVECNPLYPWQVSVYMWAAAQAGFAPALLFVGGHYDQELDTITEIEWFTYTDPPIPLNAIRKRVARWENMIAQGMDVTDLTTACTPRMFPCPMFGKGCPCQDADDDVTFDAPETDRVILEPIIAELATQASILKTAGEMEKAAKKKKKEAEERMRRYLAGVVERGDTDSTPKKVRFAGNTITHISTEVPEKVVKGYSMDYFKLTPPKEGTTPQ
jgi:hypothetical protein